MKINIITLHRVYNFGSALQAYASQVVFQKHGCNVQIIDYVTPIRTKSYLLKASKGKPLFYRLGKLLSIVIKEYTFGGFLKKYCNITKKYITANDLACDPPYADVYVTGSDQTWNSTYNGGIDRGFFLDFLPEHAKRVSFVSSFGKDNLCESEKKETKRLLDRYSAISVREDTALRILESLGINKGIQLIDPTLQLNKEEWLEIASKRLIKERYLILMLLYQEDNNATEYARLIADQKGLKLVKLSWDLIKPSNIDKLMTHRSPNDFLSLFYYADFVVTNSFHGLAFSINFEKQFIVVPRNEYNSRIDSLLRVCNLSSRLVSTKTDAEKQSNIQIDFNNVVLAIEHERKVAESFINNVVTLETSDENSM